MMSTVRIVCTILSTNHGIDTMSEETLSEYCQKKLSEEFVIVPYGEHECAIYNRKSKQYLTLYSNRADAEKDLKFILES